MIENSDPGTRPPDSEELGPLLAEARASVMEHVLRHPRRRRLAVKWVIGIVASGILFASGLGVGGAFAAKTAPLLPARVQFIDCYGSASDQTPFTQIVWITRAGKPYSAPALTSVGLSLPASPAAARSTAWSSFARLNALRAQAAATQAQYLCGLTARADGTAAHCSSPMPSPTEQPPPSWVRCVSDIPHTIIVVAAGSGTAKQACAALGLKSH